MGSSWTMGLSVALAAVDSGGIIERLVVAAIVAIVTGVITAVVATRELKAAVKSLSRSVAELAKTVSAQQEEISRLREARATCELRAATRYATHGEVGHLLGEMSHQWRDVLKKLDEIHGRITPVAERVSALEGAAQAACQSLPAEKES